jgi:hypothetical protein
MQAILEVARQEAASRPSALARSETDTDGKPNVQGSDDRNPKFGISFITTLYTGF